MNILDKTLLDKNFHLKSKENLSDEKKQEKKYPNGPNEKQGYPDEKQPNDDDLHQDHMIENDPKRTKEKIKKLSWLNPRTTFKGWTLIM